MNKVIFACFFIIMLIINSLTSLKADDFDCTWDSYDFANEAQKKPEITSFLTGKIHILPNEIIKKFQNEDSLQKSAQTQNSTENTSQLLEKTRKLRDFITSGIESGIESDFQQQLFGFIIKKAENFAESQSKLIFNINYVFELGNDWRMRGELSIRPNDKFQLKFQDAKEKIFRKEISKLLNIKSDNQNLQPVAYCKALIPFFEYLENLIFYNKNNVLSEFVANLYFSFGDFLLIAGLKHSAFRAYKRAEILTNSQEIKKLAIQAAFEIQDSVWCDKYNFSDDFLEKQRKEASAFIAYFKEFAGQKFQENPNVTYQELKKTFSFKLSQEISRPSQIIYVVLSIFVIVFLFLAIKIIRKLHKKKLSAG